MNCALALDTLVAPFGAGRLPNAHAMHVVVDVGIDEIMELVPENT